MAWDALLRPRGGRRNKCVRFGWRAIPAEGGWQCVRVAVEEGADGHEPRQLGCRLRECATQERTHEHPGREDGAHQPHGPRAVALVGDLSCVRVGRSGLGVGARVC